MGAPHWTGGVLSENQVHEGRWLLGSRGTWSWQQNISAHSKHRRKCNSKLLRFGIQGPLRSSPVHPALPYHITMLHAYTPSQALFLLLGRPFAALDPHPWPPQALVQPIQSLKSSPEARLLEVFPDSPNCWSLYFPGNNSAIIASTTWWSAPTQGLCFSHLNVFAALHGIWQWEVLPNRLTEGKAEEKTEKTIIFLLKRTKIEVPFFREVG